MYTNNKKSKKNKSIFNNLISNLFLISLTIIILGFISSGINRFLFNNGTNSDYQDLSTLITKSTYEKETGHKIQLEIWNGCGISKLALMYTDYLRNEGLDVLDSKNADHFNYLHTTILHHRGNISLAKDLAEKLHIDTKYIINDNNEDLFYDLTLIIGKDYMNLPSYRNAVLFQPPF